MFPSLRVDPPGAPSDAWPLVMAMRLSKNICTHVSAKELVPVFFSQKHLRCLGSRLVALAAGERD